jgi:hypothetical protein
MQKPTPSATATVIVSYPSGVQSALLASELKMAESPRAKKVLQDVHLKQATLACCGFKLYAKKRRGAYHACAENSDVHTCGWFGLGGHQRAPAPMSESLAGSGEETPNLLINLDPTPSASIQAHSHEESQVHDATTESQRRISLSSLIDYLLVSARLNDQSNGDHMGEPLLRIRKLASASRINGVPSVSVMYVAHPGDAASSWPQFVETSQASLAPTGTGLGRLVVVVGETTGLDESVYGFELRLRGLGPSITLAGTTITCARTSYPRAFFRINDPQGSRVLVAASVWIREDQALAGHALGLVLVSDSYSPADSHHEVMLSNQFKQEDIRFLKPRRSLSEWIRGVPDFIVAAGRIIIEVAGLWSESYLRNLARKVTDYRAKGKAVLVWHVGLGERLADFMYRVRKVLRDHARDQ